MDLDSLWRQLGVHSDGILSDRFDDEATLAAVRPGYHDEKISAAAQDPTLSSSSSQFLLAGPWVFVIGMAEVDRNSGVISLCVMIREEQPEATHSRQVRGHRAIRSCLSGQSVQPRKGSRSHPAGGQARCTANSRLVGKLIGCLWISSLAGCLSGAQRWPGKPFREGCLRRSSRSNLASSPLEKSERTPREAREI